MIMRRVILAAALPAGLLAATLAATTTPAKAQAQVSFAGKRIEFVVPFAEGGGADAYARFMADQMRPHLPGNPGIVIRNIPGGGSITGANQFTARAQPDGLTLLTLSASTQLNFILGDRRVRFDPRRFIPVIGSPLGSVVYVAPGLGASGPQDVAALRGRDLVIGANGPTSADLPRLVALDMLGLSVRTVFGINRGQARLAYQRGELNINGDDMASWVPQVLPLVQAGRAVPLFTLGYADAQGRLGRDPNLPDLPSFPEVYRAIHGSDPAGPAWAAFQALFAVLVSNTVALVLPEGTPPELVAAWREAARRTVASDTFKERAPQMIGPYPPALDDVAQRNLLAAVTLPPEAKDWLAAWLKRQYNVDLGAPAN
ncbi:MAG: tricarboxylate transporter [Alphaproteobacteria bacterium]|nr:tricarboxylate transporter [Alphaproteobacteria bacterium]